MDEYSHLNKSHDLLWSFQIWTSFQTQNPLTEEELPGPQEEGLCNTTASIHCNDCSDSSRKETYDHLFG